jgi:hypothetical protein
MGYTMARPGYTKATSDCGEEKEGVSRKRRER